jgi:hypothetical protein
LLLAISCINSHSFSFSLVLKGECTVWGCDKWKLPFCVPWGGLRGNGLCCQWWLVCVVSGGWFAEFVDFKVCVPMCYW